MTMLHPGQLVDQLTDAFEMADISGTKSTTLAECVPLLAIALEFIGRGPAALTVEAVEKYRTNALRIIESVRPVVEREADMTFADWVHGANEPIELRAAA